MNISRRDMLKMGLFGSAALMLPMERVARTKLALANRIPSSRLPKPFTVPFAAPPVAQKYSATAGTDYYLMEQRLADVEILPGLKTPIFGYNGASPGPTIVNQQGTQTVVRQNNLLPDVHPKLRYKPWTSTHLHGSASLPQYDGYASDKTDPGQGKDYVYPNFQVARTLWYHDHGVHITAENAYMGLAGLYILHDPQELSLPIPHGPYDVPLVIKDAMFATDGSLVYDDNSESGIYGDVILVNGKPWPIMEVERRKYRFRILNASVSRSYEYSLSTGDPLHVIATDGGLMPGPVAVPSIKHSMAERYEVIIDFAKYKPGQTILLKNTNPKNNIEYDTTQNIMAFKVVGDPAAGSQWANFNAIPDVLNPDSEVMKLEEKDSVKTRSFEFERANGGWTINGTTWEDVVNSGYKQVLANPGLNDVEIWELRNPHGGWFHPVHIHLVDFKVLDRNGQPPRPYELGPKDVVYLGENETVRVLAKFGPQTGKYMMHCHNLVHEDHDMMCQFEVGSGGDDPIEAVRPVDIAKLPRLPR
jgi:spore coat protein A, manganese oxidase